MFYKRTKRLAEHREENKQSYLIISLIYIQME